MVMQSEKKKAKFGARAEVKKEDGIKPLAAIHTIVYGNDEKAPARAIFTPYNGTERKELLALGAARELTDAEATLFAAGTKEVEPIKPTNQPDTTGSSSDVLG